MPRLHPPALTEPLTAAERARVAANVPLAGEIAKLYLGKGVERDDLVQAGTFGLVIGVRRFDPGRKAKFATFAARWVRHYCQVCARESRGRIRVPHHAAVKARRYRKAARELGPGATFGEACGRAGYVTPAHREIIGRAVSAAAAVNPGPEDWRGAAWHGDGPDAAAELADDLAALRAALAELKDDRKRTVLALRFGLDGGGGRSLREIGDALGLTKERARQLEAEALKELRELMGVTKAERSFRKGA